jgi:NADPH2:quinone reductase
MTQLLWPVPAGWSAEEGAAFPVNYFTALLAYWQAGLLRLGTPEGPLPGKRQSAPRVLIQAVAGGVGTAAVQIGKLLGLEMWGTSSSDGKLARVQELGLQHPINYGEHDYEAVVREQTNGEGVDAVFEMLGGDHVAKGVRCLRDFGTLVVYGSATGQKPQLDTRLLYAKGTSVRGLWLTYLSKHREVMSQAWERLAKWTSEGYLRPVIGSVVPMEQAADAYRSMINRENFGKIVIKID